MIDWAGFEFVGAVTVAIDRASAPNGHQFGRLPGTVRPGNL